MKFITKGKDFLQPGESLGGQKVVTMNSNSIAMNIINFFLCAGL